jgi:N6-adenosine-specific RNA methylase IME4
VRVSARSPGSASSVVRSLTTTATPAERRSTSPAISAASPRREPRAKDVTDEGGHVKIAKQVPAAGLLKVEEARALLAECKRVDEAKSIRDKAEAIEIYLRRSNASSEAIADAQEIKLRAERRIGELDKEIEKSAGGRPPKTGDHQSPVSTLQDRFHTKTRGAAKKFAQRCRDLAAPPEEEFDEEVKKARSNGERPGARIRGKQKKKRQHKRIAEQARTAVPIEGFAPSPVIYADPPWQYGNTAGVSAAEDHYPTMSLAEICALGPRLPATKDAVLFLWATSPLLPEAFQVLSAWGFTYKGSMVWDKDMGTGNWVLNCHELLLIAVRGDMPCPAPENRPKSVVQAKRGAHSAKPAEFAALIERMYPGIEPVEMFARAPRAGWRAWGNEAAA